MSKVDKLLLNDIAKSLIVRARAASAEAAAEKLDTLPQDTSYGMLHKALTSQHEAIEALTARFAAEIDVLIAAGERMERELAIVKGQMERLSNLQSTQYSNVQRVVGEVNDLAETFVERLSEQFEQRLQAHPAGR